MNEIIFEKDHLNCSELKKHKSLGDFDSKMLLGQIAVVNDDFEAFSMMDRMTAFWNSSHQY